MFVTFVCDVHEDVMMFGNIATQLIKMMGHSGTVPGAILAEDVPAALEQLQNAVTNEKNKSRFDNARYNDEDEDEEKITLSQRAYPLIELLKHAKAHNKDVLWKRVG